MYKNILVPLDGSKRAERILPHVEEIAFRFEASVVLLRVVGLIGSSTHLNVPFSKLDLENEEQIYDDAKSYLTAIRGEFREKDIKAKAVLKKGPVVRWICDVASSEDVDLIAMASHGHTGLERVFYGSVAAGVLHQVDRPANRERRCGKNDRNIKPDRLPGCSDASPIKRIHMNGELKFAIFDGPRKDWRKI